MKSGVDPSELVKTYNRTNSEVAERIRELKERVKKMRINPEMQKFISEEEMEQIEFLEDSIRQSDSTEEVEMFTDLIATIIENVIERYIEEYESRNLSEKDKKVEAQLMP